LTGRKGLASQEAPGQGIVVTIRAWTLEVLDDPAEMGAFGRGCEGPAGKGTRHVVGGDQLDPLGLPLTVGRTECLGQDGRIVVVPLDEHLLETTAEGVDDRPGEVGSQILQVGHVTPRLGVGIVDHGGGEPGAGASCLIQQRATGLGEAGGVSVATRKYDRGGRLTADIAQAVQQIILLILQRPLEPPSQVGLDSADSLIATL